MEYSFKRRSVEALKRNSEIDSFFFKKICKHTNITAITIDVEFISLCHMKNVCTGMEPNCRQFSDSERS